MDSFLVNFKVVRFSANERHKASYTQVAPFDWLKYIQQKRQKAIRTHNEAVLRAKGSAFSVAIDASESVDNLEKTIKKNKKNDAVDAGKLQLFFARDRRFAVRDDGDHVATSRFLRRGEDIGVRVDVRLEQIGKEKAHSFFVRTACSLCAWTRVTQLTT